jgi:hypothetical protein
VRDLQGCLRSGARGAQRRRAMARCGREPLPSGPSKVVNRPLSHRKPWTMPSASVYSPTTWPRLLTPNGWVFTEPRTLSLVNRPR